VHRPLRIIFTFSLFLHLSQTLTYIIINAFPLVHSFRLRYHAAMCAISGLNPQRFRGFGPSDPRLYAFLQESRFRTRLNKNQSQESILAASQDMIAKYGSESYLNAPCRAITDSLFTSLQKYYDTTAMSVRHEVNMSAQMEGRVRLADILNTQRQSKHYIGPTQQGGSRKRRKRKDEDEWTASDK
jgi:hypothetical protein